MNIVIGIQARSTSTRLPNKAREPICGIRMLERVVSACSAAANRVRDKKAEAKMTVVVLTPFGDPIADEFADVAEVLEGDQDDVLSRYVAAMERYSADYIVRVTGDCPLVQSNIIIGLTLFAVNKSYDYISNVDERFRTAIDGHDCEVLSRKMLEWTDEQATLQTDREHVTTLIRREPPGWANMGIALNNVDLSDIKLSVDTPEDLEVVRKAFDSAFSKYQGASRIYGRKNVHRM